MSEAEKVAAQNQVIKAVQEAGTARVIVDLNFNLKDNLLGAEDAAQFKQLHEMQLAVLKRTTGSTDLTNVKPFQIVPSLSFEVTPAQLQRLFSRPGCADGRR